MEGHSASEAAHSAGEAASEAASEAAHITSAAAPVEKMNYVDHASLTFFTNPLYYGILQRKKMANIKDNGPEVKFYRKRITSLFKDLLKPDNEISNREIKEIHSIFVNTAIRYFEILDTKDIVQRQHTNDNALANDDALANNINDDDALANDINDDDALANEIKDEDLPAFSAANDLMMRKTITVSNLDNYIISKQDNSMNEVRIIPIKLEIDLKTHDLKTKGVTPKKSKSKKKKEDLSI